MVTMRRWKTETWAGMAWLRAAEEDLDMLRAMFRRSSSHHASVAAATVLVMLSVLGVGTTTAQTPSAQPTGSPGPTLETKRGLHTATLLDDGSVLIVGGVGEGREPLASAELYHPESRAFSTVGSLGEPRLGHVAALLDDGSVLIIGGADFEKPASMERYDPRARAFSPAGSLDRSYGYGVTRLADGRLLIAGGSSPDYRQLDSAALYDPTSASLTPVGSMSIARAGHTQTLLADGRVLILGGQQGDDDTGLTAELFDPETRRFATLPAPFMGYGASPTTLLGDGRVLIAALTYVLFDPSTERFTLIDAMTDSRGLHTVTTLADGSAVVIGGGGIGEMYASAERFDQTTERFEMAGSLAQVRIMHTATRLQDDSVLVVGGLGEGDHPLKTAELYDPATQRFTTLGSPPASDSLARAVDAASVSDLDLAQRFPATLGGQSLEVRTLSGDEWLDLYAGGTAADRAARDAIEDFASTIGVTTDDLSLGLALHEPSLGNHAAVAAVRLGVARASAFVEPVIALMLGDILEPALSPGTVSGKDVVQVVDAAIPGTYPRYVYADGDVVWLIEAEEPFLSEIFDALP
jgi:hypothetical protein